MKMEKRIYGLETEYGIIDLSDDSTAGISALNDFFDAIYEKIKNGGGYQNRFFYLNGAYIYLENTGNHPEYATPECAGVKDLIRWDKAGERIFEETMTKINRELIESGLIDRQIRLYKNNVDASGFATYGCHENYMVKRQTAEVPLYQCLIPFLVSRQILCGSGYIDESGFKISQRADFIHQVKSQGSTDSAAANRAIIHIKDEPLADKNLWRRLHLILGDANMAQISTLLKIGTTALVLRMIEDEFMAESEILILQTPAWDLKKISQDPKCRLDVFLNDSEIQLAAAEIQRKYLEMAKKYLSRFDETKREWLEITRIWEKTLDALEENSDYLFGRIDWATKKRLMESVLQKHGFDWKDFKEKIGEPKTQEILNELKIIDICYHDIRRDAGIYNFLEKEGLAETLVSEKDIQAAKTEPPPDTRANWRADLIKLPKKEVFQNAKISVNITDWNSANLTKQNISLAFPENYSLQRDDPLDYTPADLEEIATELKIKRSPE